MRERWNSGAYWGRIALANLRFVAQVLLCLILLDGLAYADDGVDRAESTMSVESKRSKLPLFMLRSSGSLATKGGAGWCAFPLDYPDYAKARWDHRLGKTWADQIVAKRNWLRSIYEEEEVILSSKEQAKVLIFMSRLAQILRKTTADMLVGSEGNPPPLLVFRTIARNLERAPSWPSEVRNTVMCYLDVFNDYDRKGDVSGAFYGAYQRCELPPGRRGDIASLIKRKRAIVKAYCGKDVPFPASVAQE